MTSITRTIRTHVRAIIDDDPERLQQLKERTFGFVMLLPTETKRKAFIRSLRDITPELLTVAPVRVEAVELPADWRGFDVPQ